MDQRILADHHRLLMKFQYYNNEQSRFFQYLLPELLHRLTRISIPSSYAFLRFVFVFAAFLAFHQFLRKWFSTATSFAGVLFLAASIPLTYRNDLQESAPLLMLLFVLDLWAIRENHDFLYVGILLLGGGFTNENNAGHAHRLLLLSLSMGLELDWHHKRGKNRPKNHFAGFYLLFLPRVLFVILPRKAAAGWGLAFAG